MNKYKYKSYEEYIEVQIAAADWKKDTHQWAVECEIKLLADYIERFGPGRMNQGLCHGVRSGSEVRWFSNYLNSVNIYGTDLLISLSKNIIQHDFNKPLKRKIKFDFVYSNSFDHAYSIDTFDVWMKQLVHNGLLLIETSGRDEKSNKTDCLGMEIIDFIKLPGLIDVIPLDATFRQKYKLVFVYRKSK